ncbi:hypothetical protein Trydic_g2322 [Trypoxylus dichotomus]
MGSFGKAKASTTSRSPRTMLQRYAKMNDLRPEQAAQTKQGRKTVLPPKLEQLAEYILAIEAKLKYEQASMVGYAEVVARKGKKDKSAERGSLNTVVASTSAAGDFASPIIVSPRKNMNIQLMKGGLFVKLIQVAGYNPTSLLDGLNILFIQLNEFK